MSQNRISGTDTQTVILGQDGYGDSLTVASTGEVAPTVAGAAAIVAPARLAYAHLSNHGTLLGADGPTVDHGDGLAGGIGVRWDSAGRIANIGVIEGGTGGQTNAGYYGEFGGAGGAGVVLGAGLLDNHGLIAGGAAAYGYQGGNGGVGVLATAHVHVTNDGTILGGAFGFGHDDSFSSEYNDGQAGAGVTFEAGGALSNGGLIKGADDSIASKFAAGASGVNLAGHGSIANTGTIQGGAGASYRGYALGGGFAGGAGVDFSGSGTLSNAGTIAGGTGGYAQYGLEAVAGPGKGGAGGAGVFLSGGVVLHNSGTLVGGAGGAAESGASTAYPNYGGTGGAGAVLSGGTGTNAGLISGGAGAGGFLGELGEGGIGVSLTGGAVLGNSGTITGGVGGSYGRYPSVGGAGGAGVFINGGRLDDAGVVTGGAGGQGASVAGPAGDAVVFGAAGGTVVVEAGGSIEGAFGGWGTADTIDLRGVLSSSATFANGTLSLLDAGGAVVDRLAFDGTHTSGDFAVGSDHAGGTFVFDPAAPAHGTSHPDHEPSHFSDLAALHFRP